MNEPRTPGGNSPSTDFEALANLYRDNLLNDVMPFWERHSIDRECGGYFNCLDRRGEVFDTDKFLWLQGRQVWTLSMLYRNVEVRPAWLEIARHGAEFLKRHGRDSDGKWYFSLTRQRQPLVQPYNWFTDWLRAGVDQKVYVVGYANGDMGYLPTQVAYAEGGYEVEVAHFFYGGFRPKCGGLELFAREASGLLRQLKHRDEEPRTCLRLAAAKGTQVVCVRGEARGELVRYIQVTQTDDSANSCRHLVEVMAFHQ